MAVRVDVNPVLLTWALERSRIEREELERKFPKLRDWEEGERAPTLKQLESFAHATKTPLGYLLLQEPPNEPLPIPDYRTMGGAAIGRPSPDLLDTIFQCQQRQDWYRDFARATGEERLPFVGAFGTTTPIGEAATEIRDALGFDVEERGANWSSALRLLIDQAEELGVLVMLNGVVGNNTHRKLNPREFRGFALVDAIATFVDAADYYLVAHAHAHAHTVVTHEVAANSRLKIKIPNACGAMGVPWTTPFEMLRAAGARFVMGA